MGGWGVYKGVLQWRVLVLKPRVGQITYWVLCLELRCLMTLQLDFFRPQRGIRVAHKYSTGRES